jgi:phosphoribosylaminoimidazole-succinocarboxamide synthase
LMVNGFQGGKTEIIPTMTPEIIEGITGRYTELYNVLSGKTLVPRSYENIIEEMEQNIINGIEILNA